jgi:hypoxanthine-DNA glycosylase
MKASFPPVADSRTRVLVLGSLPGEISLRQGQYYANARNQFWRLITAVTGVEFDGRPYRDRLAALLEVGVGLWDVVRSADRIGSLDANIRGHSPNDLDALARRLPALRAIAFNGGTAAKIGRRHLGLAYRLPLIDLPSSSPAHAIAFERKEGEWVRLKPFLQGEARDGGGAFFDKPGMTKIVGPQGKS